MEFWMKDTENQQKRQSVGVVFAERSETICGVVLEERVVKRTRSTQHLWMEEKRGNRINMVILDACKNQIDSLVAVG